MTSTAQLDRERITARVSASVAQTLQQAAELSGATLNQFVVQSALERARSVIDSVERERAIRLSHEDTKLLVRLLERPPKANKSLAKAIAHYKSRLRDGTLHTAAGGDS